MALINCNECGKEISDKATSCPHCGAPVEKKFCIHCGSQIDKDCIVCPKCGKQVQELKQQSGQPIYINNSASSSSSASSSASVRYRTSARKLPWYLSVFWILTFGFFTGGLYWIIGPILRIIWKSHN